MNATLRRRIQQRAGFRCEYCHVHEDDEPYSFHIEHIIPRKHGGSSHSSNLAWSCQNCNLGKGPNLSGYARGEVIPLFDPRRQNWSRHFRWNGAVLVGRTKCGRVTIQVLNINSDERIRLRKLLIAAGDILI